MTHDLAFGMPGDDQAIILAIWCVGLVVFCAFVFLLFRFLWRPGSRKD
jgi:hypothetical protein